MRGKNWITLVLTATLTFATMSLPVYAQQSTERYRGRGVIINGMLDAKRANGHSWMEELTNVIVPWE